MKGLHEWWDQPEAEVPPVITEERAGQYATKKRAMRIARARTQKTGKWHKAVPAHCWRDGQKMSCWTVVIAK